MMYRYINDVLLRGGQDALSVNWLEITEVHAATGEQLYHNSLITNHQISDDNVAELGQAGRSRWKVESVPQAHRKAACYELTTSA